MRLGVRVVPDLSSPGPASERALKVSTKFCERFSFALSFLLVMTTSDFSSPVYLFLREIEWH